MWSGFIFHLRFVADVGYEEFERVSDGDGFTFNEHRSLGCMCIMRV